MLKDMKLSVRQFMILVLIVTIGDSILILPSLTAAEAKQDAWIASIFSLLVGLPVVVLLYFTSKLFPNLTLVEYSEKLFGKWLGILVSMFFLSYPFFSAAAHLREIGDFMTTQIMPETPIEAIHIFFILVVLFAVRLGLEPIARTAEVFFPWLMILFLFLVIFIFPQSKIQHLQPILEEGIKPVLRGSLTFIAFPFMELVVFLMFIPFVNEPKKVLPSLLWGATIGGLVLIVITTLSILVLGSDLTARTFYPSYELAKKINVGDFLERIESLLTGIWLITIFFKITIYFYSVVLGLAQVFRLTDLRPLILPLGFILIPTSLIISPNIVYFSQVVGKIWPFYDFTYSVILPLLLLATAFFRKRWKLKSANSS